MKLASSLFVVVLVSLLTASPASALKSAVKCESGLTPIDHVPMTTQLTASPTMVPAVVPPAPTPALTQAPVVLTPVLAPADADADADAEDAYGAPTDADAGDASAPEDDDDSTPESETATLALTPAPVAQPASAYGGEVGAEYDFDDLNESESAQQPPSPAPATQTQTQTSNTPQDGVDPTTCLDAHNRVRAEVGVAPLTWDAGLASKGAAWAQRMADLNFFDHNTPGQSDDQMNNLYSGTDCLAAVEAFASEKPLFPADRVMRQDGYKSYGHYSMMVWRATTRVGCGRGADKNLVCYYETPGNTVGQAAY